MPWLIALLMLPVLPVLAGTAWAQGSGRDRLAAERQRLSDRFSVEERACSERFVVTACMDELQVRRRAALAPLRERELALMDAERQQRADGGQTSRALHAAERARTAAKRAELMDARQAEPARGNGARTAAGKSALALPTPMSASAAAR